MSDTAASPGSKAVSLAANMLICVGLRCFNGRESARLNAPELVVGTCGWLAARNFFNRLGNTNWTFSHCLRFGWIQPDQMLDHPEAFKNNWRSRTYVIILKDVAT